MKHLRLAFPHIGKEDELHNAGLICHGHPDGTIYGARAIRQAVDAIQSGIPLDTYAESHPELKKALEIWSKP